MKNKKNIFTAKVNLSQKSFIPPKFFLSSAAKA